MTSEEATYLESLGFVPSAFSTSAYVMLGDDGVKAVVEREPFAYGQVVLRWRCRTPVQWNQGKRIYQADVKHNDLTTLIVLAKLEGIL